LIRSPLIGSWFGLDRLEHVSEEGFVFVLCLPCREPSYQRYTKMRNQKFRARPVAPGSLCHSILGETTSL
jgi:hypothetical protein